MTPTKEYTKRIQRSCFPSSGQSTDNERIDAGDIGILSLDKKDFEQEIKIRYQVFQEIYVQKRHYDLEFK